MDKPTFDPGLTQQFGAPLRRIINKDGTFNVRRHGVTWRDIHPYLYLINMSWPAFFTVVFLSYLVANTVFALAYFIIPGVELKGADATTDLGRFLETFFFSAQTLTTVGYGGIAPHGVPANVLSSLESMVGVMGFALATGLLFGRVSKPSARIGFSERMAIAPYQDGRSLQFRIVNKRLNSLMDLEAKMMLMTVEGAGESSVPKRTYQILKLERESVYFFPLTWTIVHPIVEGSPLYGKTLAELEKLQAEVLILIKGYDDTFSQTVHARYSYRYDEVEWGARFAPAFHVDEAGDLVLEVNKVGALTTADSPSAA
jgi:inward rectifier potassium channel